MSDSIPKISIVVPAYNVEAEIERCIHSLIHQTYQNLEILVVDDGSADSTGKMLDQLSQEDSRIVAIHQENKGASLARETGIHAASGDFLMFCDSDDYYDTNACEVLFHAIQQSRADIAVGSYSKHEENQVSQYGISNAEIRLDSTEAINCLLEGRYFPGSLCAKLYRRTLFDNLTIPLHVSFNEDILMLYYLLKNSCGMVVIKPVVYHYIVRPQSSCGQMDRDMRMKDVLAVAEAIFQDAAGEDFMDAARSRYVRFLLDDYRNAFKQHNYSQAQKTRREILSCVPEPSAIHAKGLRYSIWMLRYIPWVYRNVYGIYDKIRMPNWDL